MDKQQLQNELSSARIDKNLSQLDILAEKALSEFPNEAFSQYYKGEFLLALNDFNSAIPFLKKAVELDPKTEYQISLGLAKMEIGEDAAAKEIFDNALKADSKNPDLYYALAIYHLSTSEDEALKALNSALLLNPSHINVLDLRVEVNKLLGNDSEALNDLNKLVGLEPHALAWRIQRIALLKTVGKLEEAEEDFRFIIDHHPFDIEFRIAFGDFYADSADYSNAIYCYSDALDIEKRAGLKTAEPLKKRGRAYLRKAEYYKCIDDLKAAMKIDAEDPDIYLGLAEAQLGLQKTDLALNYLEIGLDALYDGHWRLYEKQGEIALQLKDYDLAEASFKGMTRDLQGKAEGFYQLGALYLRQGDMEMAYKALKESDDNLHDMAEEMINTHLKQFVLSETRLAEKELQAEFADEIAENANSAALSKAFGKLWRLDEKTTLDKNTVLGSLPAEMKSQILQAFKGMLLRISPSGLLIFNLGQEDTRAVYSINSELGDELNLETYPFGRSSSELNLKCLDNSIALCGIGSKNSALDLYFLSCNFNELPDKIQQNYKEKEAAGTMDFLLS
jgi:tetratricopeptide (TPR) repeat protein